MDTQAYISSGVIEAYVMGVATEEEVQILECIRKHNPQVQQAILDAQNVLEAVISQQAVAPSPHLKSSIWAAIRESEESESTGSFTITSKQQTITSNTTDKFKNRFKLIASAASVLLVIAIGLIGYISLKKNQLQNQLAEMESKQNKEEQRYAQLQRKWDMSSDPDMKTILLVGVDQHPGMKAMVYVNKGNNQTYLSIENLPSAPKGHQYQLWAIIDGKPIDAGMYDCASVELIQKMHIIENPQAFAITLEKEGGSQFPTMEQMYVMGKV